MAESPWRIHGLSVEGYRHRRTGTPCQDACTYTASASVSVLAVADGAGVAHTPTKGPCTPSSWRPSTSGAGQPPRPAARPARRSTSCSRTPSTTWPRSSWTPTAARPPTTPRPSPSWSSRPAGSAISASATASSWSAPERRTGNGSSTSSRSRPPSASTATRPSSSPRPTHPADCAPTAWRTRASTASCSPPTASHRPPSPLSGGGPPQPNTSFVEAVLGSLDTPGPVTDKAHESLAALLRSDRLTSLNADDKTLLRAVRAVTP